jgi:hypothetical protein
MADISAAQIANAAKLDRPYAPSLVDRLTDWVDRLTIPSWTFYVGLWLVLYAIEVLTQWTGGAAGSLQPFHVVFVGTIPLVLMLIHYLDRTAEAALSKFRSVLDCSESDYARLRYRLITLPARPVLIAAVISIVVEVLLPSSDALDRRLFVDTPLSNNYNAAVSLVLSVANGILVYHTLHQLIVVTQIYRHARINLFNLGPLYTFSNLSARTAIGILAIAYSWYATIPEFFNEGNGVLTGLVLLAVTILTFILPLRGVHNLLVEEKARLLAECVRRQEAVIAKLHEDIDADNMASMDDRNKALESLEIEQQVLSRISSWPWQPETVRWFVAALLFPVIIWLMQWALQRVLGS